MRTTKISCELCNEYIAEYYDLGYNEKRGKCPSCGVDFPLE